MRLVLLLRCRVPYPEPGEIQRRRGLLCWYMSPGLCHNAADGWLKLGPGSSSGGSALLFLICDSWKQKNMDVQKCVVNTGLSLCCLHFMENIITPSFRYGIVWILGMLLTNVLTTTITLSKFWTFLSKNNNLWTDFEIFGNFYVATLNLPKFFCLRFSLGKSFEFWKITKKPKF